MSMSTAEPVVCWFQECRKDAVERVGGKNSSLGELIHAGVRVPPGFAITTEGYRRFFHQSGLEGRVLDRLKGLDPTDMEALESASTAIRAEIEAVPFTLDFEDSVAEYYRRLSTHCCVPAVPVAVRSSATAEDLPGASFAGQQDTFLWVRGVDDVLHYVRRCFSSLFTGRAIAYRARMGFPHDKVAISVGIQKMANSAAAGVMFTINPTNGDRSSIVVNSNFGFGESVVSGEVTPDEFLINKISMEVIRRSVPAKEMYYAVDRVSQTCVRHDLPMERRAVQSILDEDLLELARMGKAIEKHYGQPMDIEWAVDNDMPTGGNVFILQARPETVWSAKKAESAPAPAAPKTAAEMILASIMAGKKLG
ncbi:MAG: phenylphosphate synthase subunit beta [Rhodospirillales bacterium]|nr:phenylphosphate synthase subunit beta [Rhodospirillales bacterium]